MKQQQQQQSLNRNNSTGGSNSSMMNPLGGGRTPTNNVVAPGNAPVQHQLLSNQFSAQQQQHNKSSLNLGLMQHQQQQPQGLNSPQNLTGSVNANNNLTNMLLTNSAANNSNNMTNSMQNALSGSGNPSPQPQIQHQLIESFKLAVSSGLISADLLNTKLPQEVLNLLYQLFQMLNSYLAANNKIGNINKRRTQLSAQQLKAEMDLATNEAQAYKDNLISLQAKINAAHLILKQQGGVQKMPGGTPVAASSSSSSSSLLSTPPANAANSSMLSGLLQSNELGNRVANLELAAAAAGVQLNDLPILKDHNQLNQFNNSQQQQQQRSKLLQLLNETNDGNQLGKSMPISRQQSYQPGQQQQMSQKLQSQFSQPANFGGANQWSNFNPNLLMSEQGGAPIDDRITPFIPGQLWAGSQSSIEDDPNCTPGSVSKPLLTETIDPEIILNGLRGSQWSNFSDTNSLLNNANSSLFMGGGQTANRQQQQQSSGISRNPTTANNNQNNWSQNSFSNSSQLNQNLNNNNNNNNMNNASMNGPNGGSIGEQLWGIGSRSSSRMGNSIVNMPINAGLNQSSGGNQNLNRNSNSFNNNQLMNQQQQQQSQQMFRSNNNNNNNNSNNNNTWNPQQGQQQQQQQQQQINNNNNQSSVNNNFPTVSINSGHFILLRNVSAQVTT